ncbi:MAG: hypothetical protein AB8E15_00190 [Bdellovibrionales bacterium]
MKQFLPFVISLFFFNPIAHSKEQTNQYFEISNIEIHELIDAGFGKMGNLDFYQFNNDLLLSKTMAPSIESLGKILQLIKIGKELWSVVESNKPVVNFSGDHVSVLPNTMTSPLQLQNWQGPETRAYRVVYKNAYGIEVVDFVFRIVFTHSGETPERQGKFIANAGIYPAHLDVAWGYNFDAKVISKKPINLGSTKNPVAGQEMSLSWTVKTVLREHHRQLDFFIDGEGNLKSLF